MTLSNVKRVVLTIVLSILTIIVLVDTFFVIVLSRTISDMSANPVGYFPSLEKPNAYVKIDDVGYILYDGVVLDSERIESGDIKVYTSEELYKITADAAAKRDGLNNTGSSN